jgi:RNA polymerase sigma-70 factor (ECF subfamily)
MAYVAGQHWRGSSLRKKRAGGGSKAGMGYHFSAGFRYTIWVSITDERLIAEYLEGNERALAALVDRHLPAVYHFAFSLTHDAQMAEDIAQESFIKAWKNIRRFIPTRSFQTWLFSIARNTAIDLLRKKREVALSSFEDERGENPIIAALADDSPLASELMEKAEDAAYARLLLESIEPLYRDVLTLRYERNLTFAEIGRVLKRPLHTVKSQHRRAIASLQRALGAKPA